MKFTEFLIGEIPTKKIEEGYEEDSLISISRKDHDRLKANIERIRGLLRGNKNLQKYVSGDDRLKTMPEVVDTVRMVLERLADDLEHARYE